MSAPVIPLPAAAEAEYTSSAAALVAAFLAVTAGLSVQEAARVAGVRTETLRKWRRRPPRWLKAETARRIAAHLAGEPPVAATPDEGMRRAFRVALRATPAEGR